jgi:hypothetical protein
VHVVHEGSERLIRQAGGDAGEDLEQKVQLTAAGKRALRRAQERSVAVLDRATRSWTDDEVESLVTALRRLRHDYLLASLEDG